MADSQSRIVNTFDGLTRSGNVANSISGRDSVNRTGQYINEAFAFLQTEDYNAYKFYDHNRQDPSTIDSDHYFPNDGGELYMNGPKNKQSKRESNGYSNRDSNGYSNRQPRHYSNGASNSYFDRNLIAHTSRQSNVHTDRQSNINNNRQLNGNTNMYQSDSHFTRHITPSRHSNGHADMDPNRHNVKYGLQIRTIKLALAIVVVLLFVVIIVGVTLIFVLQVGNGSGKDNGKGIYTYILEVEFNTTWDSSYQETSSQAANFAAANTPTALKAMLINAITKVFTHGGISKNYNSTGIVTLEESLNGNVLAKTKLLFIDANGDFNRERLREFAEAELQEELKDHLPVDLGIISLTIASSPHTITTPVTQATTTEPSFTIALPTPKPTVAMTCVAIPSSSPCAQYYSSTRETSANISIKFQKFLKVKDRGCYAHITRFACSVFYPECKDRRLLKPCRMFCEAFRTSCNYPIKCDDYYNDDDPSNCALPPGYTAPAGPDPPEYAPCPSSKFRCGTDPPTCVEASKRCDGRRDCVDGSDETSQRAQCDPKINNSLLDCDFSYGLNCSYGHQFGGDFNWIVVQPPILSGPSFDHTTITTTGYVLLADASGQQVGAIARIGRNTLIINADQCLHFYYHMAGADTGLLKVKVLDSDSNENAAFIRTGAQTQFWRKAEVTLVSGTTGVVFEFRRGVGYRGDIAIDDIIARAGKCVKPGCDPADFACENGNCQQPSVICNGKTECGDFSDEVNCNCTSSDFKCATGMCVAGYLRCDEISQCPDGSDEENCGSACSHGRYKCNNGVCIQPSWVCDGVNDCQDNSDEQKCSSCTAEQFQCEDITTCIEKTKICDAKNDCPSGSDEHDCFTHVADKTVIVKNGLMSGLLCADNLPNTDTINSEICTVLGKGSFVTRTAIEKTSETYIKVLNTGVVSNKPLLNSLQSSDTCADNNVVVIDCKEKVCGSMKVAINQIVNGRNATAGKWPWKAALYSKNEDSFNTFICGATIINDFHIITAAHCLETVDNSAERLEVMVGSINKDNPNAADAGQHQARDVQKILTFNDYLPNAYYLGNDVSILQLSRRLTFDDFVQPICLPDATAVYGPSAFCYSAGWGYNAEGIFPSYLQHARQKLWEFSVCTDKYLNTLNVKSVCAGYQSGYISTCQGDSGGPLMCKNQHDQWSLVGVLSFGARQNGNVCTKPDKPSVFTKVQAFIPWIQTQMECFFDCGNGECVYDALLMCDGIPDCSNRKDETGPSCTKTVDCDFSINFKCGYTSPLTEEMEWKKGVGSLTGNRGPTTDHTQGKLNAGHYMYAERKYSVLFSPVYTQGAAHCISFYTQMRGEPSAHLKAFVTRVTADVEPWAIPVNTVSEFPFDRTGSRHNGWLRNQIDIPLGGTYVFGMIASSTSELGTGIGIDDIKLTAGSCASAGCPADNVLCVSTPTDIQVTCIPKTPRMCNYVTDCRPLGTDEGPCSVTDLMDYRCNFDVYDECGFYQHHSESTPVDELDWRLVTADEKVSNQPPHDANTPLTPGGNFLLLDTYVQSTGNQAVITLFLGNNRNSRGCFQFQYWIRSNGTLMVTIDGGTHAWKQDKGTSTSWAQVQIYIETYHTAITIIGKPPRSELGGFMAIDDVTFLIGGCSSPVCSLGYMKCKYNGQCVSNTTKCDGNFDCEDQSDEHNCECTGDMFKCVTSGKCIRNTYKCDEFNDCADYSDEKSCECSKFQCSNGLCIDINDKCNRIDDCGDESDEEFAACPDCQSWEMKCADNKTCIPNEWKCDGLKDCDDGSDELNCVCQHDHLFRCTETNNCISPTNRCDGNNDCTFTDDEAGCGSGVKRCFGASLTCDCGQRGMAATNHIVGGQVAAANTWPWACALYYDGRFLCGCVLINTGWVITAAHCFHLKPLTHKFRVRVGVTYSPIESGGIVYSIKSAIVHPNYSYQTLGTNDVALLQLVDLVTFSSSVSPVCMPEQDQEFTQNSHCFLIGWGFTSHGGGTPRQLRAVRMLIYRSLYCEMSWGTYQLNTTLQICAGYKKALLHTCNGDSGSPLMCKDATTEMWQLVGLVTGGHGDCDRPIQVATKPPVFARIPAYIDWIQQTISGN